MTVFITGATSQIGHFLLPRLRAADYSVVALSRREPSMEQPGIRWITADLLAPGARIEPGSPLRAIVSFGPLGGLSAWLRRESTAPARRVIATSSMSVLTKRASVVEAERHLVTQLAAGEAGLIEQCERLGIAWTILRPTLIYGAALDKSLTPIARRAARWRIFPIPAGDGLRQPIHADDLAQAVMRCLETDNAARKTLAIGGGERLSAKTMFARVRECLPFRTLPVVLGLPVLKTMAMLLPSVRGPVSRLRTDLIADNDEVEHLLRLRMRPFNPEAAMFGFTS